MHLDIRLPIGLMFACIGTIVAIFGVVSDPAIYQRSLGININLVWGIVMLIFGLLMLLLAWRASRISTAAAQTNTLPADQRGSRSH